MADNIPDGISRYDIEEAIRDLKAGEEHLFGDSTGYDVLYEGERYPPKALIGLAARRLNGAPLGPYDFKGGKGTLCFRLLEKNDFKIVAKTGYSDNPGELVSEQWTDDELRAAVEAYLWMLDKQERRIPYVKSHVNASLRGGLLGKRTKASVEFRMQNITSVFDELCMPTVSGYPPHANVGEQVKQRILGFLDDLGLVDAADFELSADPAEIDKRSSNLRKRKLMGKPKGSKQPNLTVVQTTQAVRDPLVKAFVLQEADGVCECCGNPAPFQKDDGSPYLEVHHLRTLADNGSDTVENAVAICPNCHRELHYGANRGALMVEFRGKVMRFVAE